MVATGLPVLFVACLFGSIWGIYVQFHIANLHTPLIRAPTNVVVQLEDAAGTNTLVSSEEVFESQAWTLAMPTESTEGIDAMRSLRARRQCVISHALTCMFVICFLRTVFTSPGTVPRSYRLDVDGEQQSEAATSSMQLLPTFREAKEQGGPRSCKWCKCYKPDRCHHCRVCGVCVLRMDHHCPWVANCIGFRNHKFFLLLVMYAWLSALYCGITMYESVEEMFYRRLSRFTQQFALVFALTLCGITSALLSAFGGFHFWLTVRGATTIEFCEKANTKNGSLKTNTSMYDCGLFANLRAVLGPCVLTWFLPIMPPEGDGLTFPVVTEALRLPGPPSRGYRRRCFPAQGKLPLAPPMEPISDKDDESDDSSGDNRRASRLASQVVGEEQEPQQEISPVGTSCIEKYQQVRRVRWAEE